MSVVARQITMELREALVTLTSAKEQFRIAKEGLKAAVTQVQLARERFRVLSSSSVELSNATFSLVRAEGQSHRWIVSGECVAREPGSRHGTSRSPPISNACPLHRSTSRNVSQSQVILGSQTIRLQMWRW